MVDVQVVSDWILWDTPHGLAWLWSRDTPDVEDPFPTLVDTLGKRLTPASRR